MLEDIIHQGEQMRLEGLSETSSGRGQNVALRSPGPKDRRSLCSELKEREGSS